MIRNDRLSDSLELFLALKEARQCEPVTLKDYRCAIERFIALPFVPRDVGALADDHLILWLADLRRSGNSPASLAWHQRHLYVWLRWLHERGEITRTIWRTVPIVNAPVKHGRAVDADAFVRLLTVAGDRGRNRRGTLAKVEHRLRNVAILYCLWSTGVRRAELARVELADVDLRRGEMLIHGKTKRERVVPFDAATKAALAEYVISERGREPGALFLARGGVAMTPGAMALMLDALEKRAGVTVSSHDFRRGFAARMRRAGLDLGHTARLMGHSTLTMTLRYSETGEEAAAIAAYRKVIG